MVASMAQRHRRCDALELESHHAPRDGASSTDHNSAATLPMTADTAPALRAALGRSSGPFVAFALGGVLLVTAFVLTTDRVVQAVIYDAAGVGSIGAILLGLAIHRPTDRRSWLIIAAALGCWMGGDLIWDYHEIVLGNSPFPSEADALYLAGYPVFFIGILSLLLVAGRRTDVAGVIDAAIVAIGFGLAFWVFLIVPTLSDPAANELERAVATLYPVGDILVLAMTVRFAFGLERVTAPAGFLVFGLVLQVVADGLFAQKLIAVTEGGLEVFWIAGYIAFGAAALHPDIAEPLRPRQPSPNVSGRRMLVLMAASLLAPAVLFVQWAIGMMIEAPAIALASATLFSLVVARIAGLIRALRATIADREALAIELRRLAHHDALTGLVNRAVFEDRLEHALARREPQPAVAVIYVDLDDFKTINDDHGHAAGDAVLQSVAERIAESVRAEDTAARLGGDEFGVIIDRVESADAVSRIAARVKEAVERPVHTGDRTFLPRASIGTALGIPGRTDPDGLLRDADFAMYADKRERFRVAPSGRPAQAGFVGDAATSP